MQQRNRSNIWSAELKIPFSGRSERAVRNARLGCRDGRRSSRNPAMLRALSRRSAMLSWRPSVPTPLAAAPYLDPLLPRAIEPEHQDTLATILQLGNEFRSRFVVRWGATSKTDEVGRVKRSPSSTLSSVPFSSCMPRRKVTSGSFSSHLPVRSTRQLLSARRRYGHS